MYNDGEKTALFQCSALDSVTHMRINKSPSIRESTRLRTLQLAIPFQEVLNFIGDLKTGTYSYPSLELLGFRSFGWNSEQKAEVRRISSEEWFNFPFIIDLQDIHDDWSVKIPREDERSCGEGMPCSQWI